MPSSTNDNEFFNDMNRFFFSNNYITLSQTNDLSQVIKFRVTGPISQVYV